MKKGYIFLGSAAAFCLVGFDIVGLIVAGAGIYTGKVELN